jgi:hypothetical protein
LTVAFHGQPEKTAKIEILDYFRGGRQAWCRAHAFGMLGR